MTLLILLMTRQVMNSVRSKEMMAVSRNETGYPFLDQLYNLLEKLRIAYIA